MKLSFGTDLRKRLSRVALGEEPGDIILNNGRVLNVYTGEVLPGQVVIAGERIAYVGREHGFPVGPETRVVDVDGQTIIPGLIDGHIHMDAWMALGEFSKLMLPRGTTAVITECTTAANTVGLQGVLEFVRAFQHQPMRIFTVAPVISFLCSRRSRGSAISFAEMQQVLALPEVVGLGEIYWPRLLLTGEGEKLTGLIETAAALGKTVEGHGAGAKNQKLAALAALGIDACHEPITAHEVRERLRLGLAAKIREGSVRQELQQVIKPLKEMNLDLRRAILVSDGVWVDVLTNFGHMDHIVQKAINLGLDPVSAIRMATLNVAEYFKLDGDLGGIAPGKCADLVVIPDIDTIQARLVICKGRVVAEKGRMTAELGDNSYLENFPQALVVSPVQPADFEVRVPVTAGEIRVRAIEMVTDILNCEAAVTLPVEDGAVSLVPGGDILKAVVMDRFEGSGRRAVGFIKGYGMRRGAVASSFSFDEGNLTAIGSNDVDLAAAVNRIRELQGGLVYCCDGRVEAEIPMPVMGSISRLAGYELAAEFAAFRKLLEAAGCSGKNPLLTLFTLTFTAIPSLRLLSEGYWLSKENRLADLILK